jgi:hypothetical protein
MAGHCSQLFVGWDLGLSVSTTHLSDGPVDMEEGQGPLLGTCSLLIPDPQERSW